MFCPTVFGDVTSANIVGYKSQDVGGDGFVQITPVFDSVNTANSIKLSDFTFVPARGDNIQIFDQYGDCVKQITWEKHKASEGGQFYWQLADMTEDPENPEYTEITDYTFDRGLSIWLQFGSEINFTEAGAVNKGEVVYTVGDGFCHAGNPRPTDLKLTELVFSNKARGDNIQIFDQYGDCVKQITWEKHKASEGGQFYWQLADMTEDPDDPKYSEITDYTFPAGSAFWIQCGSEGTVTIPAMTLE